MNCPTTKEKTGKLALHMPWRRSIYAVPVRPNACPNAIHPSHHASEFAKEASSETRLATLRKPSLSGRSARSEPRAWAFNPFIVLPWRPSIRISRRKVPRLVCLDPVIPSEDLS